MQVELNNGYTFTISVGDTIINQLSGMNENDFQNLRYIFNNIDFSSDEMNEFVKKHKDGKLEKIDLLVPIKYLVNAAKSEMEIVIKYLEKKDIERAHRHANSGKNILSNVNDNLEEFFCIEKGVKKYE